MQRLPPLAESLAVSDKIMVKRQERPEQRLSRRVRRLGLACLGAIATIGLIVGAIAITMPRTAPATHLHYTPNHNFGPDGRYLPAAAGFNLADLNTVEQLESLPPGAKGLVWVGQCDGVTPAFLQKVQPFIGHAKLFGFYLVDSPDPNPQLNSSGYVPACTPEHLKAESDWIHANLPGAKTFMILMNLGSASNPWFSDRYAPDIIHLDLYGINPYPCRTELGGCSYDMIDRYVTQAKAIGVPLSQMVPVYQAFGGGDYKDDAGGRYILPSVAEEKQLLARWAALLAAPAFDCAYSWGLQENDSALEAAEALHPIFAAHNNTKLLAGMNLGW